MFDADRDRRVRLAAFNWLDAQVTASGDDVLPRALLAEGFTLGGVRVPMLGPQGIFKPRVLTAAPLSITTVPSGPYHDAFGPSGLRYKYRGKDRSHRDNRGLRFAMQHHLPLIYCFGLMPGRYLAVWPVYVVGDDPGALTFTIQVDDRQHAIDQWREPGLIHDDGGSSRREYVTAAVRHRLHQRGFRERVLDAYRRQCAFCRFRHPELLDAAHIVPDTEPGGEPTVRNGLALCKLHHAAFDRYFVGVRPDYVVEVRHDLLDEEDGPTLVHGIQALHGNRIIVPRNPDARPDAERLERRYQQFLRA